MPRPVTVVDVAIDVSIIVPAYNEAENILPLAEEIAAAMRALPQSYELVFVDDASQDPTWDRIRDAARANPRVRGLRHARNSGQSAAVWTGLRASSGPIIATLDGDCQNDPADLPRLLQELAQYDFICGVRSKRQDSPVRRWSSRVSRWARKQALGIDYQDTGCGFRAFKRSALDGVLPFNGWHRLLPVLVHGNGVRILELPIHHRPRLAGISKYGVWNRLGRGVVDLLVLAWLLKRRLNAVPYTELDQNTAQESTPARLAGSESLTGSESRL